MPELPEVESFKKYIDKTSLHQKIEMVNVFARNVLLNTTVKKLIDTLQGNSFEGTFRHGKFLFLKLKNGGYLMLHFGLTGDVEYWDAESDPPKYRALHIQFESGNNFAFTDTRKMGKIAIVTDAEKFVESRGYGKDALKISREEFAEKLGKRRVAVKTVLMDQKVVAGVGNEWSDEILFQCKIHPESVSQQLKSRQVKKIYEAMVSNMREAVKHNADRTKMKHLFFLDNRKAGLKCPRCEGTTAFKTIGGRSSYFCPSCQKLNR